MISKSMWLIGIDDTDVPETRGTGRLARMVAGELAGLGLAQRGVTRHQLLVHPDVPYTSHNSSACIGVDDLDDPEGLFAWVCGYVAERSPDGADPGVCVARTSQIGDNVRHFGRRAQQQVVDVAEARRLAREAGILLAGLAGTEDGVIGALASVGLRAGGADGRFIEIGRIRELGDRSQVKTLIEAGVDAVQCVDGGAPLQEDWVATFGWVRPRLMGGSAVLLVKRETHHGVDWVVADRRKGGAGHESGGPAASHNAGGPA